MSSTARETGEQLRILEDPDPSRQAPNLGSQGPAAILERLAVLTAFVLPIALLPYIVVRRRLIILQRKFDVGNSVLRASQGELERALLEVQQEKIRMQATLEGVQLDMKKLRHELEEGTRKATWNDMAFHDLRNGLQMLLEERK